MIERGRGIVRKIGEIARTVRPSAAERLAKNSLLREYTLEALGKLGEADWPKIKGEIDGSHPLPTPGRFWGSATNATPREMQRILRGLKDDKLVVSRRVRPESDLYSSSRAIPPEIILWKLKPQETPQN